MSEMSEMAAIDFHGRTLIQEMPGSRVTALKVDYSVFRGGIKYMEI